VRVNVCCLPLHRSGGCGFVLCFVFWNVVGVGGVRGLLADLIVRCTTWKVILCIADVGSATGGKA